MIAKGSGGAIVNVSSQASMIALKDHTLYCKFAYQSLMLNDCIKKYNLQNYTIKSKFKFRKT